MSPRLPTLMLAMTCFCVSAPPAQAHETTTGQVDFQSEASRLLPNDQLHAVLYVELTERDPAQLSRGLARTMNDALHATQAWPAVKASSGNQSSWPLYGKNNHLDGWRGRAELVLDSQDFKAAGEALAALQDKLQLQGISFVVSEAARQSAEQALTRDAIAAFRQRADGIRSAWGASSYQLVQMNLGSNGAQPRPPMPVMMMRAASADAMPAPAELSGGESRLTITASGSIRLQP